MGGKRDILVAKQCFIVTTESFWPHPSRVTFACTTPTASSSNQVTSAGTTNEPEPFLPDRIFPQETQNQLQRCVQTDAPSPLGRTTTTEPPAESRTLKATAWRHALMQATHVVMAAAVFVAAMHPRCIYAAVFSRKIACRNVALPASGFCRHTRVTQSEDMHRRRHLADTSTEGDVCCL